MRRPASCRLESVESVAFRKALGEEQAKEDAAGPPPRLKAAIRAKFLELVELRSRCIVCRRPDPECGGTWILGPEQAVSLGLPANVAPVFVYRICLPCVEKLRATPRRTSDSRPMPWRIIRRIMPLTSPRSTRLIIHRA
jgi:hypothetical protein